MFNKESIKATKMIFAIIQQPETSFTFKSIQSIILRSFTSVYVQGRIDQKNKVRFIVSTRGVVVIPDK
ncbi:hypothetical protein ES708_30720 [subsurface metagenome]